MNYYYYIKDTMALMFTTPEGYEYNFNLSPGHPFHNTHSFADDFTAISFTTGNGSRVEEDINIALHIGRSCPCGCGCYFRIAESAYGEGYYYGGGYDGEEEEEEYLMKSGG
jgi:hypothetical protein